MDESEQQDRMKKMEREYERRQQEILLEAEAAVRAREEALNQVCICISFCICICCESQGGGAQPGLRNIWISSKNLSIGNSSFYGAFLKSQGLFINEY